MQINMIEMSNYFCYFVVDLISAELYSKYQVIDTKLNMIFFSLNSNKKNANLKKKITQKNHTQKKQYNIVYSALR